MEVALGELAVKYSEIGFKRDNNNECWKLRAWPLNLFQFSDVSH